MHLRCCFRSMARRFHTSRRITLQWKSRMFQSIPRLQKGQQRYSETLWKYFNAPGNAFFVTTNVVTLTGMVIYSTVSTMSRQATIIDSLENGFGVENSFDAVYDDKQNFAVPKRPRSEVSWRERSQLKKHAMEQRRSEVTGENSNAAANVETISDPFLDSNPEGKGLQSANSYMVKMGIFYLFYSFHIYKKSLETGVKVNDKMLQKLLDNVSQNERDLHDIQNAAFYKSWRHEFGALLKNLSKAQHFSVPKPESFPEELQDVFKRLSDSKMTFQSDFYEFYQSINDISQRRLLQLWYYDNSRNLLKQNNFSNERIYEQMVFESSQWNNDLFEKYISVLYQPNSRRFQSMFNNYFKGMTSVSLDTVLGVLKGLIGSNVQRKNDHIVKVVSLLRKNSVLAGKKKLRVIIPTEDKIPLLEQIMTADVRKNTYSVMAKNPVALKLLSTLGGVKPN
ncbi:Pet494 [Kluyveromyces lactis]|nr:Pet494 [Kluyveromyces lactis]